MNVFPSGTLNCSMLDAFVNHSFIRTLIPKYDRRQRFLESDDSVRAKRCRYVGWDRVGELDAVGIRKDLQSSQRV